MSAMLGESLGMVMMPSVDRFPVVALISSIVWEFPIPGLLLSTTASPEGATVTRRGSKSAPTDSVVTAPVLGSSSRTPLY